MRSLIFGSRGVQDERRASGGRPKGLACVLSKSSRMAEESLKDELRAALSAPGASAAQPAQRWPGEGRGGAEAIASGA